MDTYVADKKALEEDSAKAAGYVADNAGATDGILGSVGL